MVGGGDEAVLRVDVGAIPIDDARRISIRGEQLDEAPVPDGGSAHVDGAAAVPNFAPQASPLVEVGAREVQIAKVASVVQVEEQVVDVRGEADGAQLGGVQHAELTPDKGLQVADAHADEVVDVGELVRDQNENEYEHQLQIRITVLHIL